METLKPVLKEKLTYVVQNFLPKPNDLPLKVSEHPHKLFLDSGVSIRQKEVPNIPLTWFNFKDYKSINNGKVRPDLLFGKVIRPCYSFKFKFFANLFNHDTSLHLYYSNAFVDVIGAIHEITYFQPTGDKPKACFTIRDLK